MLEDNPAMKAYLEAHDARDELTILLAANVIRQMGAIKISSKWLHHSNDDVMISVKPYIVYEIIARSGPILSDGVSHNNSLRDDFISLTACIVEQRNAFIAKQQSVHSNE